MPNPLSLFNLPSTFQVQQQVNQQRQSMWASGNPAAMQQATMATALDALFGNPQVKRIKSLQDRIASATADLQPIEGESDLSREIRRLHAVRDAVADIDPSIASQVNTQILQLGQMKLEQDKLIAGERRAAAKEDRESTLFPFKFTDAVANATQNVNEGQNWMNPRTGEMKTVLKTDQEEQANLMARGWVQAGNPRLQGSKEDITGLQKPVVTDLQKGLVESDSQLSTLVTIFRKYKPEFSSLPEQIQMAGADWFERAGGSLSPKTVAAKQQFDSWRTQSTQALNAYIKFITGAQAAVAEYDRLKTAFPNDEMGTTKYVAALRETMRNVLGIRKRYQEALSSGLEVSPKMQQQCRTPGQPCFWDKIPIPTVSDEELDAFMQQAGIVPPKAEEAPAAAGAPGLSDSELCKKYGGSC